MFLRNSLSMYSQPAILLPANPTALLRPAQPTESAKDIGHPTPNSGSIKIVLPETTPGQILAGRLRGTTLSALQPIRDFTGKLITVSLSSAERVRYNQPQIYTPTGKSVADPL